MPEYGYKMSRDKNGLCDGSMQQTILKNVYSFCAPVSLIAARSGYSNRQVASTLWHLRSKGLVDIVKTAPRVFLWHRTRSE